MALLNLPAARSTCAAAYTHATAAMATAASRILRLLLLLDLLLLLLLRGLAGRSQQGSRLPVALPPTLTLTLSLSASCLGCGP